MNENPIITQQHINRISAAIGTNLIPCISSNVVAYGYKAKNLWILFKGDKLYKFPNISKEMFRDLDVAQSKGKWVSKNLRNKVECEAYDVTY